MLLARGADPNKEDKYGNTPLYVAALPRHNHAVKVLLHGGADPNKVVYERNPLRWEQQEGHQEVVPVPLDAGSDVCFSGCSLVQAPIQTSMAFTYETWGVSVFRPEKGSKMSITDGATGGAKLKISRLKAAACSAAKAVWVQNAVETDCSRNRLQ